MMEGSTHQPWPMIRAMSGGALEALKAAHRLGLRVDDDRQRFAFGREVFPRYVDCVHIGAVLAHCGRLCARAEALCKTAAPARDQRLQDLARPGALLAPRQRRNPRKTCPTHPQHEA